MKYLIVMGTVTVICFIYILITYNKVEMTDSNIHTPSSSGSSSSDCGDCSSCVGGGSW